MIWHSRYALVVVTLAILSFVGRASSAEGTRRALLVGIDQYNPPEGQELRRVGTGGRKRIRDLKGCKNDVAVLYEQLISPKWGFKPADVEKLVDQEAGRQQVLDAIQKHLIDVAQRGDIVFFFFSGHGSRALSEVKTEQDGMDETIVPADTLLGADDITDKKLAVYFNKILDRVGPEGSLTVLFDSCHSGSAARDAEMSDWNKRAEPVASSVKERIRLEQEPWERGALILSAARDDEEAMEHRDRKPPRAAFAGALTDVLETIDPNASAGAIFEMARARLKSDRRFVQEPVIECLPLRRSRGLFGEYAGGTGGRARVAVINVEAGRAQLQGGLALGLRPGSELSRPRGHSGGPLRVRVGDDVTLTRCAAEAVEGDIASLRPGEFLEVSRWALPNDPYLRVWLPPSNVSTAGVRKLAAQVSALRGSSKHEWVEDPSEALPTHVLLWKGSSWTLKDVSDGREETLGAELSPAALSTRLSQRSAGKPRLFVWLPPPKELVKDIKLGVSGETDSVQVASTALGADYHLVGRLNAGRVEYCWSLPAFLMRPGANPILEKGQSISRSRSIPLPARTNWVPLGDGDAGATLEEYALRLGKIRAWLTLASPQDDGAFPYRLALKRVSDGSTVTTGPVYGGETYRLVLQADPATLDKSRGLERRHVYVFAIDVNGNSSLLFPQSDSFENKYPIDDTPQTTDDVDWKPEIELPMRRSVEILQPFGPDTYVLLSTSEPLSSPTALLEFVGVRKSEVRTDPLENLLAQVGAASRAGGLSAPSGWNIYRLTIESKDPREKP